MLTSILVPIDGSTFAEQALPTALRLAQRCGASLELVLVREPMPSFLARSGAPVPDSQLDYELRQEARDHLSFVARQFEVTLGERLATTFLEGPAAPTLLQHIEQAAPSLVVMTTHARGGVSRAWMGSVADRLVRRASAPVLLLRPSEGGADLPAGPPFPRVLIPLDGSASGDEIIPHAMDVAGAEDVEFTLVRVVAAGQSPAASITPRRGEPASSRAQLATVEARLTARAEALRARGFTVKIRTVVHPDAARGILEYANEMRADLIAMVTRSEGGLERLVMGSVADKVVRGADWPVLLLNPLHAPAPVAAGTAAAP